MYFAFQLGDKMPNGDTRPQYGLPFQQLPVRDITPESFINEQTRIGRREIDDRYKLMWNEINRSAKFTGRQKAANMRRQLMTKGKQEMLQFNQKMQQQADQLDNINRLAEVGLINNPDEIKARMAFGADVAKSMYPTPAKERTIPQQFGELDVYSHRISQELEWFKEDKPSKLLKGLGFVSPLAGAISIYRGQRKPKRKVRIYDPTTEDWEKATPEETTRYDMLLQEEKNIATRKTELLGQPGISRRRIQPGTRGGTFSDKIAESVRPQRQARQRPTPTATELRQRGTREAYEQGKKLGYWN